MQKYVKASANPLRGHKTENEKLKLFSLSMLSKKKVIIYT